MDRIIWSDDEGPAADPDTVVRRSVVSQSGGPILFEFADIETRATALLDLTLITDRSVDGELVISVRDVGVSTQKQVG